MTADELFRLSNSTALASWLLLIVTGWSPRASRVISSLITGLLVPALLCGVYLTLVLAHWGGHKGGFGTLSGVMLLFTDRWAVLAVWVHYLAFDLFIGSWQYVARTNAGVARAILVLSFALLAYRFWQVFLRIVTGREQRPDR